LRVFVRRTATHGVIAAGSGSIWGVEHINIRLAVATSSLEQVLLGVTEPSLDRSDCLVLGRKERAALAKQR
jgi:hypothetical protein